jgi:hypothetical protein
MSDASQTVEVLDATTAPRAGLVFEHCFITTGYQREDGPEPVTFEITEVTEDGKVFYGPAQRGLPTVASRWIWKRDFHRDALGIYVGDRRAA